MFRLLGFCIGSLLSIVALVLLVGMPEFHLSGDDIDEARFDTAVEKLKAKRVAALPDRVPSGDTPSQTAAPPASAPGAASTTDTNSPRPLPDEQEAQTDAAAAGAAETIEAPVEGGSAPEWHALWTPFRSELAARGFISRLENVTGFDYQVTRTDSGGYQVALPYVTVDDLDAKLSQIAAATGLDLSGSPP